MPSYTIELLRNAGPEPVMRYLFPRIAARTDITYGEIAERLRGDLNIASRIFPTQIGHVAGALQDRIFEIDPSAPLINALIVRSDSAEASRGIDGYLRRKYGIPDRAKLSDRRRGELLAEAAAEVYAFDGWKEIFSRAFNAPAPLAAPEGDIGGTERDGQTPRGPAESEEHRKLKAHVLANPQLVGARGPLVNQLDEYRLLSGDEVDVFFAKRNEFWLVEVKSERSNERDMIRGCYQAIKYRAVFRAQLSRTLPDARVNAVLVTRGKLPASAKALVGEHEIRHVQVIEY